MIKTKTKQKKKTDYNEEHIFTAVYHLYKHHHECYINIALPLCRNVL